MSGVIDDGAHVEDSSTGEPEMQGAPKRLGRYQVLLKLGTGGMASVYLGRASLVDDSHREVAIKVMHPEIRAKGLRAVREFLNEARIGGTIRHANVVPVLEVGEDPAGIFLVMDYVEGATLSAVWRAQRKRHQPIPIPIVGRILLDVLAGLNAAHEFRSDSGEPLVHRDVSPSNVLIGVDGVSRLTDFGIARTTDALGLTASGSIRGKVDYMAPERIRAEGLDPRCDIWAVGVIAWELLANRRLFRGESAAATLLKVLEAPAPPLSAVRPELSAEIVAAVARALEVDIHRRHANAEQFRRQLLQAWRSAGEIAEPSEVGAYVRDIVGTKLRERRARVSEIRTLREEVLPQKADRAEDTTVEDVAASPTRWRFFKRWSIVAAAVVVIVGIAVASTLRTAPPIDSAASPLGAETPSAAPTSAGSLPPAPSAAPASERVLTISSDVEMVSVYVGERAISPPLPTRKLEVHLTPEEARSDPLRLVAVSRDGRRASAELDTSQPFPLGAELPEPQWKAVSRGSAPRTRATRPPPIIR